MTVIAYRDGFVSVDSLAISGGVKSTLQKFAIVGDALLVGTGFQTQFLQFVHWYKNGADPAKWPTVDRNDYTGVIVFEGGKILEYEWLPHPIEIIDPYIAWGSGCDIAMGAMYMGASAEQACMAAAEHHNGCGGQIHVFKVA